LLGARHRRRDAGLIGHIERDHVGVASAGLDVAAQVFEAIQAPAGQHDSRARLGQGFGELGAQATRGTGDQRHPAR